MVVGMNMTETGKMETKIGELGAWGIIREAYKLVSTHSQVFMSIYFTLMLQLAILVVAFDYVIYRNFPPQELRNFKAFFHMGASGLQLGMGLIPLLLLTAVFTIAFEAAVSLSSSAMLHVVGLHYAGQSVNFQDVLRAIIPHLWIRLTITNIYKTLLLYPMFMLQTVGSVLLFLTDDGIGLMPLRLATIGTLGMVGMVCLETIFMLAAGASVFEMKYGFTAVKRSLKLLKGRIIVAVWVQLVLLIPTIIVTTIQSSFRCRSSFEEYGFQVIPLAISYIYFMTYLWEMKAVCAGIQYASFKAFHNEELRDSVREKGDAKWGYERVGSVIDEPMVGQQARNIV